MFEILAVTGIVLLTQICKKVILPKHGATGVHIFIALVAMIIVGVHTAATFYPGFGEILKQIGMFLVTAIATYEIILKKMGL